MIPEVYTMQMPGKIIAGVNSIKNIAEVVKQFGADKIAIITDNGVWKAGYIEKPKELLESAGIRVTVINDIKSEPEAAKVKELYNLMHDNDCQMLIGIGGGSAMDVTKILSVLMTNDEFAENILDNSLIKNRGIPSIMIPTTAGTGAEVTPNAIVTVPEQQLKIGIVSDKFMPDCVILDPAITEKLPAAITASTGMDAFCHAIECYISLKANPFSDTLALRAIRLISGSIRRAYNNGSDMDARHDMMLAAMYGGMCIAASSTTAVHALSYPLGGKYRIPHGISNAMLLPYVMEYNRDAVEDKFLNVATEMGIDIQGLSKTKVSEKVVEAIFSLVNDLNISCDLKKYGITENDLEQLSESAFGVKRLLDNNPKPLSIADIKAIYRRLI